MLSLDSAQSYLKASGKTAIVHCGFDVKFSWKKQSLESRTAAVVYMVSIYKHFLNAKNFRRNWPAEIIIQYVFNHAHAYYLEREKYRTTGYVKPSRRPGYVKGSSRKGSSSQARIPTPSPDPPRPSPSPPPPQPDQPPVPVDDDMYTDGPTVPANHEADPPNPTSNAETHSDSSSSSDSSDDSSDSDSSD
ncbi:hypothetical protein NMY22_g18600 [Coprinellus aureogranulatus]|nr:hypothetical protein NMY22_g18600 [Coprinellus aureogranulatus]